MPKKMDSMSIEQLRELEEAVQDELNARLDGELGLPLNEFGQTEISQTWMKALERCKTDPLGAITLSRTLLEKVLKHILEEFMEEYAEKDDLPKLYHRVSEVLEIAPSQHIEEPAKRILGSAQSLVQGVGTLRNKHSDAHGTPHRSSHLLDARFARLAVNTACTISSFLIQTLKSNDTYWGIEAKKAADYIRRVFFEIHLGAVLWKPGIVAIFSNRGDFDEEYVYYLRESLWEADVEVLSIAQCSEEATWVILCEYNDARTLHNLAWMCLIEESMTFYLDDAKDVEIGGVQGDIANQKVGPFHYTPINE